MLLVEEVKMICSVIEVGGDLDVKNMDIASRISSPVTNCAAVDGSWSWAPPGADSGRVEVGFNFETASNATRALAFSNSGKFDAVGRNIGLEEVPE